MEVNVSRCQVEINYRNYRNERSKRVIVPKEINWGSNEWHEVPQLLLTAFDVGKQAERIFAVSDISGWEESLCKMENLNGN